MKHYKSPMKESLMKESLMKESLMKESPIKESPMKESPIVNWASLMPNPSRVCNRSGLWGEAKVLHSSPCKYRNKAQAHAIGHHSIYCIFLIHYQSLVGMSY